MQIEVILLFEGSRIEMSVYLFTHPKWKRKAHGEASAFPYDTVFISSEFERAIAIVTASLGV